MKKIMVIMTVLAFVFSGTAYADLNDGLVAYYPFNDNDESGNGNDGIEHGGINYVEGIIGTASQFNGTGSYISVQDNGSLSLTESESEIQELYSLAQKTDLQKGLVAHYEFEDNADDTSGEGNHGQEYGGVEYTNGVIGKAGKFDGVDDFIEIMPQSDVSAIGDFTISVWTYLTDWKEQNGSPQL